MSPLGLVLVSAVLQGAGMVLHKQRVAALSQGATLGSVARRPGRFFAPLVRDAGWLLGWVLTGAGALAGLQALATVDLTLMQALGKLQLLVVIVAGVALLGERLAAADWLALGGVSLAALALSGEAEVPTGVVATPRESLGFALVSLGALAPAWLALRRRPGGGELAPAVAGGVLFGCGDLLVKSATGRVHLATGNFHALRSLGDLVATPELAVALPCYALGVVLVQAAFTVGRVSVVGPVVGTTGSLLPIVYGFAVLGERLHVARLLGLVAMLAAAALLARRSEGRHAPRRGRGGARDQSPAAADAPGTGT